MKEFFSANLSWGQRLALVATGLVLCGAGIESRQFRAPPDASAYRQKVWAAKEAVPLNIGDWNGVNLPVDQEAVTLLRPYFFMNRTYRNETTNRRVDFLFVDCQDARDTISHYPPNCYRGRGFKKENEELKDWKLPHMTVHLTEYTFASESVNGPSLMVDDFFVLPGAGTAPNRDAVIAAARNLQRRFYGVGQVQLVYQDLSTEQEREETFSEVIGPLEPLIQAVEDIPRSKP